MPCDVCDKLFIVAGTMSPRNNKWALICLEQCEGEGNFTLDLVAPRVMVRDADRREVGPVLTAHYGKGDYRPHNPSHFLEHSHGEEEQDFRRVRNPRIPMDHSDVED